MRRILIFAASLLLASTAAPGAESQSGCVVFSEAGFPAADSAGPSPEQVQTMLPGAQLASTQQLANLLNATSTRLLVLPYGSAFPEEAWPDIYRFLHRGGNLLVLGMVFGGAMSSLTPGNLATIPVLIAVNGLVFVAAGPTKWVRVEYLDPSGDRRCAYFTDGSAFGWGKVFGGTTRLYEAMQAVVLTG